MTRKPDVSGFLEHLTRGGTGGGRRDALKGRLQEALRAGRRVAARAGRRPRRRGAGRSFPSEGVVHIEYTPRMDGDPDPGEIVWAWVPFEEDPTQGKDRPVVIIGRRSDRLVGVPLTTRADDREAQVPIGAGSWDPQRRESYARVWRMLDLDPDHMRREGAILDPERFAALVAAVDHYYDVQLPA
jgi:hypothetical protein